MEKQSYRDRILAGQARFHNATGVQRVEELDPNDRTYTFVVVNGSTTASKTARLFGAAIELADTYNSNNNITVTVKESSHRQAKTDSLTGFRLQGISIIAESTAQLSNPLTITEKSSTGREYSWQWQPDNYKDPRNFDSKMIKTANFQITVDANTRIEFDVEKSETVRIITHVKDKVKTVNTIKDRSVVESADAYKSY